MQTENGADPDTRIEAAGPKPGFRISTLGLLLLPVLLLAGVIWLFARTNAGLNIAAPAPIEKLQVERTVMDEAGFHIHVRNLGPAPLTLAQVGVNDALWSFEVRPAATIRRLGKAVVHIPYPWSQGEAYAVNLLSTNAIVFPVEVPVAFATPRPQAATFWSFTLIGIYVGVIPVFLGLLWFPAMRQMSRGVRTFILAVTAGILVYLGIDATGEAVDLAGKIGDTFQGLGLAGIGIVATVLLLEAISRSQKSTATSESVRHRAVATMIAVGIGLHNLGEGLAIGAAYAVGELALGTFLVIGFIIQNITEGLGIVAPLVRERPSHWTLIWLGLIAGAPAIFGAWIGGFTYARPLSLLFLAIGAGAVFQVAWQIGRLIQKDLEVRSGPVLAFSGVTAGMVLLYVTGLLVK
jgi:zinc transporter, ZIP family